MKLIDCQYMVTPFYGPKMHLAKKQTPQRQPETCTAVDAIMGLKAIYRHPRTSPPDPVIKSTRIF